MIKKGLKRSLTVLLASAMILGMTACGDEKTPVAESEVKENSTVKEETKVEEIPEVKEDPVELICYMVGAPQTDMDEVMEQFNEMLLEDINATLEVRWIDWGEFSQKYPLVLSSGEQVDFIYARSGWETYVHNGAFSDLSELAYEYAPNTMAALNQDFIDGASIDGKLYIIPPNYVNTNVDGVAIRGDLRKKYGLPEIDSTEDFIEYLRVVKENEPDMGLWNDAGRCIPIFNGVVFGGISGTPFLYDNRDGADLTNVRLNIEIPEIVEEYRLLREGYLDGCWPKDCMVTQANSTTAFADGTMPAATINLTNFNAQLYPTVSAEHPEWEVEWYDINVNYEKIINPVSSGLAIPVSAKYPEKAMQVIELLNTNYDYWALTTYGIEGKHYTVSDTGAYQYGEGLSADNTGYAQDSWGWAWRSNEWMLSGETDWPEYKAKVEAIYENSSPSKLLGFSFDKTPVEAELAAVQAVIGEYGSTHSWGAMDVDEYIAEITKKLEAAGVEKVRAEISKQIEEFLAE